MKFVAVDKNEMLIAFLIPEAIQDAFRHVPFSVKDRMETDTRYLYTNMKRPNPKGNKRHISQQSGLVAKDEHIGSDHYGLWHANGHTLDPIVETSDSHKPAAIVRQALLHHLENTGGTMTKVLDFWFGVWDPELQEQYRLVYEKSPKLARLPPTNPGHRHYGRETYTLRVIVCNRDTDEHKDQKD